MGTSIKFAASLVASGPVPGDGPHHDKSLHVRVATRTARVLTFTMLSIACAGASQPLGPTPQREAAGAGVTALAVSELTANPSKTRAVRAVIERSYSETLPAVADNGKALTVGLLEGGLAHAYVWDGVTEAYGLAHGRIAFRAAGTLYIGDVTNGTRTQVPVSGTVLAAEWSPDGQRLAVLSAADQSSQLIVFSLSSGQQDVIAAGHIEDGFLRWVNDGNSLAYLVSSTPGSMLLRRTSLAERQSYDSALPPSPLLPALLSSTDVLESGTVRPCPDSPMCTVGQFQIRQRDNESVFEVRINNGWGGLQPEWAVVESVRRVGKGLLLKVLLDASPLVLYAAADGQPAVRLTADPAPVMVPVNCKPADPDAPLPLSPGQSETVERISATALRLRWRAGRDVSSYEVFITRYGTAPDGSSRVYETSVFEQRGIPPSVTELEIPAGVILPGGRYRWHVRMQPRAPGVRPFQGPALRFEAPLAAPTELRLSYSPATSETILTWNPVAGADSYSVAVFDPQARIPDKPQWSGEANGPSTVLPQVDLPTRGASEWSVSATSSDGVAGFEAVATFASGGTASGPEFRTTTQASAATQGTSPLQAQSGAQAAACPNGAATCACATYVNSTAAYQDTALVEDEVVNSVMDGLDKNRIPLILIHGVFGNQDASKNDSAVNPVRNYFIGLLMHWQNHPYFNRKYKLYRFHYVSNKHNLCEIAAALRDRLDELMESKAEFRNPLVIVAHSMGGLVARYYMNEFTQKKGSQANVIAGANVSQLITLATPHHGSPVANGGVRVPWSSAIWRSVVDAGTAFYWPFTTALTTLLPNRSDLRFDNFNGLFTTDAYVGTSEENVLLRSILHSYDSKIVAYYGNLGSTDSIKKIGQMSAESAGFNAALGDRATQMNIAAVVLERIWQQSFSSDITEVHNDGVVPVESGRFAQSSGAGSSASRTIGCAGHNHSMMKDGSPSKCENNQYLFDSLDADLSLAAPSAPLENILTLSITGEGLVYAITSDQQTACSSNCSLRFARGTVVTVSASPASTWTFNGWSGACSGSAGCAVALSSDTAVTATFIGPGGLNVLSVSPNPQQVNLPISIQVQVKKTDGTTYPAGTPVTFTSNLPGLFSSYSSAYTVTSTSSPSTVLTDANGSAWIRFTAIASGTAQILATSMGLSATASAAFSVPSPGAFRLEMSSYYTGSANYMMVTRVLSSATGLPVKYPWVYYSTNNAQCTFQGSRNQGAVDGRDWYQMSCTGTGMVTVTAKYSATGDLTNAPSASITFPFRTAASAPGALKVVQALPLASTAYGVAYSPDGSALGVSLTDANEFRLYGTANWDLRSSVTSMSRKPAQVQFAPDGTAVLVAALYGSYILSPAAATLSRGGNDGEQATWLSNTSYMDASYSTLYYHGTRNSLGATWATLPLDDSGAQQRLRLESRLTACGGYLALTTYDYRVLAYSTASHTLLLNYQSDDIVGEPAFTSDCRYLAVTAGNRVEFFDVQNWQRRTLPVPLDSISFGSFKSLVFVDGDRKLAIGSGSGKVAVVDPNSAEVLQLGTVSDRVRELAWSQSLGQLAVGHSTGVTLIRIADDRLGPVVSELNVTPTQARPGGTISITAKVIDADSSVAAVTAQLRDSSGTTVKSTDLVPGVDDTYSATISTNGLAVGAYLLDLQTSDTSTYHNATVLSGVRSIQIALPSFTIQTNPPGLRILVDGVEQVGARTYAFQPGSTHTIAASSPQTAAGTRFVFSNWSRVLNPPGTVVEPLASATQTINVSSVDGTYTANFGIQYLLTAQVSPPGSGQVQATPASSDGYYDAGSSVTLLASPSALFSSWGGDAAGSANPLAVTMNFPKTVVANLISSTTVTTVPTGLQIAVDGGTYTSPKTFQWDPGTTHTIAALSPQDNTGTRRSFVNWSDGGAQTHTITVSPAVTSYAAVYKTQFLLTTATSPTVGGTISPASGYFDSGSEVTLSASANSGYAFAGFSGDLTATSSPQSLAMNGPKTLTANFIALTPITVNTTPTGLLITVDGTSYASPHSFQWLPGSQHTLAVSSPQDSDGVRRTFSDWSDGGSTSHSITVPASATTYTAAFSTQYLLTTNASPAAGGTISPSSGYYASGLQVSVSASANSGYSFSSFAGDLTAASSPQTLTMDRPKTVAATFIQIFTISGNAGVAAATVALSGSTTSSTTADGTGAYSFTRLAAGGNYTVTPTKANYSFTPGFRTFNSLAANQTSNFTAALNTYTISGNAGVAAATVALSGSTTSSTTADASGAYSFTGLAAGGNYTVTPSKTNYTFTPGSRTFNSLAANQTSNFTAVLNTYTISGTAGVAAATVALSGSATSSTTADASGAFSFTGLAAGGNYTVTPTKANYSFTPGFRTFSSLAANQTSNFTAALNTYTISGNAGVAAATVALSGSATSSTTADSSGAYSFNGLAAGGNYTVTPSKTNYSFTPGSRTFNSLAANQTSNFTAALNTYTISGNAGVAAATVALSGSATSSTTADSSGAYSFTGLAAGGNYTVTPTKANCSFTPGFRTFNSLAANQTSNFTAALNTYRIGGNAGVAAATVALSGSATSSTTADASGAYSFSALAAGGAYTVTPSKAGYAFNPASATFGSLAANQTANFAATQSTYTISGNAGVAAATVALSGSATSVTTADSSGAYSFAGLASGGDFTVTPSKSGWVFTPPSQSVSGLAANRTFDFTATVPPAAVVSLYPTALSMAAVSGSSAVTPTQTVRIALGGTSAAWTATSNVAWLVVGSGSGRGDGLFTVDVNAAAMPGAGSTTGKVTVSAPSVGLTAELPCTLTLTESATAPIGFFDTPTDGSTVASSIAVTGWALDDIGVASVKIWRDPVGTEAPGSLVFIGDAVFVPGARPDIESTYPTQPLRNRAGWGYMMLTNGLPNGNGVFKIYAIATDVDGRQTTLGSKTITVDNLHATNPFGAMATPRQGATVSGAAYLSQGWALTPQPGAIPTDGSTIRLFIDGMLQGTVTYNNLRTDVQSLFPGYANSAGAGGYRTIDTTALANGLHTIAWSVRDDLSRIAGVGSRYFTVLNGVSGARAATLAAQSARVEKGPRRPMMRTGWNTDAELRELGPLSVEELERIEIVLPAGDWTGFERVAGQRRSLPVGSRLDAATGRLTWQLGPGFLGDYELELVSGGQSVRVPVHVRPSHGQTAME